ncbi:hypothetical protein SALBM217S_09447 [Streptomyces griseoloalbus]
MIDLRRLHVLRSVAHYGTVTAAARALHFTPSAASQQIRQLARDLGVDLLEPQGRGVRLTPAAEACWRTPTPSRPAGTRPSWICAPTTATPPGCCG